MIAIFPELVACANERNMEELAKLVLRYFASGKFHRRLSMEKVVERFGIRITRQDGKYLGMIAARDEKGKFSIGCMIRPNLPFAEEQFLIAHLFGHFLLHIQGHIARAEWGSSGFKEIDSPLQRYLKSREASSDSQIDPKDLEADSFASNILMPTAVIQKSLAAKLSHAELAGLLGVTPEAILFRISELQSATLTRASNSPKIINQPTNRSESPMVSHKDNPRAMLEVDRSKRNLEQQSSGEPVISAKGMDRIRELANRLAKP